MDGMNNTGSYPDARARATGGSVRTTIGSLGRSLDLPGLWEGRRLGTGTSVGFQLGDWPILGSPGWGRSRVTTQGPRNKQKSEGPQGWAWIFHPIGEAMHDLRGSDE